MKTLTLILSLTASTLYAQCPDGVCPPSPQSYVIVPTMTKSVMRVSPVRSVMRTAARRVVLSLPSSRGYNPSSDWTWPGMTSASMTSHLQLTHGVSVVGLSFDQQIALHNRLHNAAKGKTFRRRTFSFFRR